MTPSESDTRGGHESGGQSEERVELSFVVPFRVKKRLREMAVERSGPNEHVTMSDLGREAIEKAYGIEMEVSGET